MTAVRTTVPVSLLLCCLVSAQPALTPGRKYTAVERLAPERLAAVRAARQEFAKQRKPLPPVGVYQDFPSVLHVHAQDAPHTLGTRDQVLAAAKSAGIRAVFFSDHGGPKPDSWQGERDGVLFFRGAEIGARHELSIAWPDAPLKIHSHVEAQLDAPSDGWDGMEIYNRHTDAEDDTELNAWLKAAEKDPAKVGQLAALAQQYPDEVFGAGADYWPRIFARWDAILEKQHMPGIAAVDAHRNTVLANGGRQVVLDPYEVAFRNSVTHIMAREFTPRSLVDSLKAGRVWVAHDWLADSKGFAFVAVNSLGLYETGDTVPMVPRTRLAVQLPIAATVRFIHNGKVASEQKGAQVTFIPVEAGAWRVEAWLDVDGELRPWIYSNPIYLQSPGLELLALPSQQLDPTVEAVNDLVFSTTSPAEAEKQKLDIYKPRDAKNLPVLVFLHGGAWVRGDRKQYPFLGNLFARQGYVVVIPSYRLAPRSPFPAQAEDAAAAIAWTLKNIGQHGGDPRRVVIAGHSAGAHLVSLIALDPKWLAAHGFSPKSLSGVAGLSGPYDLTVIEGLGAVFSTDLAARRDASPQHHVSPGAPPFLLTYSQWDYPQLPQQAVALAGALRGANIPLELVFVPGENHISEMTRIVRPDDLTATALLRFLKQSTAASQ